MAVTDENLTRHQIWLVTHPEFRCDPKVKATAEFLRRVATGPGGLR